MHLYALGGSTLDDSGHAHHANHAEGERHSGDSKPADDVKIEELSDSTLRITIGRLVEDVTVDRLYYTHRSFGPFTSLDNLVAFLRKKSEEAE
jgi:hypothetical protein